MPEKPSLVQRVIAAYTGGSLGRGYSDELWPRIAAGADKIASLLEATPPARVLDLACGTGPITTALALRGFEMTGMDCTPASLDTARSMSACKGARVQWICQDMRTIQYKEEFDCVCLMDVIFGIFEAEGEDLDLIRRISAAVKTGGRCLFEVYNKEFALEHGVEDALFHNPGTDRFVRKNARPEDLSLRLYSHDEWERMLACSGLRIARMDGWNWAKDPPPPPWRADVIVAQKD